MAGLPRFHNVLPDCLEQRLSVGLVQPAQGAFPTKSKAARGVVLALFKKVIKCAATKAIITLNVKESLPECGEICVSKFREVRQELRPAVNGSGIVSRKRS
jgi:hypothetical protein